MSPRSLRCRRSAPRRRRCPAAPGRACPARSTHRRGAAAPSGSCRAPGTGADEFVERHAGISEAPVIDGDALADEALDRVDDVPDVDVHARHHAIAAEPESDELAGCGIATEDDAVPGP